MPSDTLNKFESWVEYKNEGADFSSDVIKCALTNTVPNSSTNTLLANITQISAGNGYTTGGATVTITGSSQTGGTYTLAIDDVVFTASGGSIATFQYAVFYNDTMTGDPLIGWIDYGATVTVADGENFTIPAGNLYTDT